MAENFRKGKKSENCTAVIVAHKQKHWEEWRSGIRNELPVKMYTRQTGRPVMIPTCGMNRQRIRNSSENSLKYIELAPERLRTHEPTTHC